MAQDNYDGLLLQHDDRQTKEQVGLFAADQHGIFETQTTSSKEMKSPPGKCSRRPRPQIRRNQSKWASGGPGMQAIFLGCSPKSCGTGVFLPRTEGTDFQFRHKPAFSPVLLPSRVVQALNLNVHEIGQQNKPKSDQRKYTSKRIDKTKENKKEEKVGLSPDIFLPKEWIY